MLSSVEHSSIKQQTGRREGGRETRSEKEEKGRKSKEMERDRQRGEKRKTAVETVKAYGICLQQYRWALMLSWRFIWWIQSSHQIAALSVLLSSLSNHFSSLLAARKKKRPCIVHLQESPFSPSLSNQNILVTVSLFCTHYAVSWVFLKAIKPRWAQVWFKLT